MLVGALGSALIVYRTGQRTDVLVAARDIPAGHRVTADDLTVAGVAADEASVAGAGTERAYIGSYATTTVPKGTLVNGRMFRASGVVPGNAQLVGVVVPQTQLPSTVETGSVVAVYWTAPSYALPSQIPRVASRVLIAHQKSPRPPGAVSWA